MTTRAPQRTGYQVQWIPRLITFCSCTYLRTRLVSYRRNSAWTRSESRTSEQWYSCTQVVTLSSTLVSHAIWWCCLFETDVRRRTLTFSVMPADVRIPVISNSSRLKKTKQVLVTWCVLRTVYVQSPEITVAATLLFNVIATYTSSWLSGLRLRVAWPCFSTSNIQLSGSSVWMRASLTSDPTGVKRPCAPGPTPIYWQPFQ